MALISSIAAPTLWKLAPPPAPFTSVIAATQFPSQFRPRRAPSALSLSLRRTAPGAPINVARFRPRSSTLHRGVAASAFSGGAIWEQVFGRPDTESIASMIGRWIWGPDFEMRLLQFACFGGRSLLFEKGFRKIQAKGGGFSFSVLKRTAKMGLILKSLLMLCAIGFAIRAGYTYLGPVLWCGPDKKHNAAGRNQAKGQDSAPLFCQYNTNVFIICPPVK